jgi:hypothetical protein
MITTTFLDLERKENMLTAGRDFKREAVNLIG